MSDLSGRTTVVVGARGRGIARVFAEAGAPVVAVAQSAIDLNLPIAPQPSRASRTLRQP
jgi:NAD(P)-dependent dehydrogenase (short-subunit alcohol dehydrogenase family)